MFIPLTYVLNVMLSYIVVVLLCSVFLYPCTDSLLDSYSAFCRRSFGSVLDIIPIADTVTKLTSRCELCGKRASFTLRKTEETRTELIAGADVYMPVCRKHYVSGQVVKEATRSVLESHKVRCSSVL